MTLQIRPLVFDDFPAWLPLWIDNNEGHNDQNVTSQTWQRIIDKDEQVYGLGAFKDGEMIGILHYILHPTTGHMASACYMQDLFTKTEYRRSGTAKKLLLALQKEHQKQKWARIYWVADQKNVAAQKLYQSFGTKLDFSFHVLI